MPVELRKRARNPTPKVLENMAQQAEISISVRTRKLKSSGTTNLEERGESTATGGKRRRSQKNSGDHTERDNGTLQEKQTFEATIQAVSGFEESINVEEESKGTGEQDDTDGKKLRSSSGRGKRRKVSNSKETKNSKKDILERIEIGSKDKGMEEGTLKAKDTVDECAIGKQRQEETCPNSLAEPNNDKKGERLKPENNDSQVEESVAVSYTTNTLAMTGTELPERTIISEFEAGEMLGRMLRTKSSKRKDVDGEIGNIDESLQAANITPKRPKRSNGKQKAADLVMAKSDAPADMSAIEDGQMETSSLTKSDYPSQSTSSHRRSTRQPVPMVQDGRSDQEDKRDMIEAPKPRPVPRKATSRANTALGDKTPKFNATTGQSSPKDKRGRRGVWDKEVLLTSKKSKLAKAKDLSDLLNAATWDLLSPEEQMECLVLLPNIDKVYSSTSDGEEKPSIVPDFFESNQVFKDSLVEFQDDLLNGRYEASYLANAAKARQLRLEGAADKYKDGQYELYWGQRQRSGLIAGAAAQIKLPELIQMGLLKDGDIWAFKRKFLTKGPENAVKEIVIEKEVKVARVDVTNGKYSLAFHVPPGDHKFSHASREDLFLEGVVSPQTIETFILRIHPQAPNHIPNGNAFKVFNIWRKGEDLGMLWEIRQTYWGGE